MSPKLDWAGWLFPLHGLFSYSRITRINFPLSGKKKKRTLCYYLTSFTAVCFRFLRGWMITVQQHYGSEQGYVAQIRAFWKIVLPWDKWLAFDDVIEWVGWIGKQIFFPLWTWCTQINLTWTEIYFWWKERDGIQVCFKWSWGDCAARFISNYHGVEREEQAYN